MNRLASEISNYYLMELILHLQTIIVADHHLVYQEVMCVHVVQDCIIQAHLVLGVILIAKHVMVEVLTIASNVMVLPIISMMDTNVKYVIHTVRHALAHYQLNAIHALQDIITLPGQTNVLQDVIIL